ncbi:CARDB domain-containing protein [Corallococcus sp. CA053C]|uniref:CARDB domain-containing protein n=1 Tax=Corallococcus sp. CA053C TaxID=2316732 RepID=UPI00131534BB|nr:CARDB domain-containing protein [Corallococcus sp. CA053C]
MKTTRAMGFVAVLALGSLEAGAAAWDTCNGSPVKWYSGPAVSRNRCSIPDSGNVNTAYWNGLRQWDDLSRIVSAFNVNPVTDCALDHSDGQNEIGLCDRAAIDGNNGVTYSTVGVCFIGSNGIDEADVCIASDLDFTPRNGNAFGTSGRSTFVHESGHFFGFKHEGGHSILRTSPPHLVTGGYEASTLWPTNAQGMRDLYGYTQTKPNLLPSAMGVVGDVAQTLDPAGSRAVCRGTSTSVKFYVGNLGNAAVASYTLRVRLSPTAPPAGYSESTNVVASFGHSLAAFSEGTYSLGFVVPAGLPFNTYYVYLDMDPEGAVAELRENDNTTVSAMLLRVEC